MAIPRIGGVGIPLNLTGAIGGPLPQGTSFAPTKGSNAITLSASEVFALPAGTYLIAAGPYTSIQFLDPVENNWRTINAANSLMPITVDSDGGNYRLANLTGTPIGALITNSGSAYTNGIGTTATGLTVTISAGSSKWVPVVGGAINSTITITAGGTGYLFPPILVIDTPPEVAVRRLVQDRGMKSSEVEARMAAQATREERLALADVVVDNSGSQDDLAEEVDRAWAWIEDLRKRRGQPRPD